MAVMTLIASHVTVNSTDYSEYCSSAELTVDVDEQDVTTFGSLGWKEVLGGLKSGSLKLKFLNNMVDGEIDADVWAILGTVVTFAVRADSAATSTQNPQYSGSVLIKEWKPIAGSVGDVNTSDVTFPTSGAVTRSTT